MTTIPIKVYYDHDPRFTLGPLGCFERGGAYVLPDGREVIVCSIDPDGAGVAWLVEHLDAEADEHGNSRAREIELRHGTRTSYPADFATPRQHEQMRRVVDYNRKRYGLQPIARSAGQTA